MINPWNIPLLTISHSPINHYQTMKYPMGRWRVHWKYGAGAATLRTWRFSVWRSWPMSGARPKKKNNKQHWQFGGQFVTLLWIYLYLIYIYIYIISICVHVYSCMHRAYKSLGHTLMYIAIIAYRKRIVRQNSLSPQATCVPCWLLKSRLSWWNFFIIFVWPPLLIKASCVLVKSNIFSEVIIFVGKIIMFIGSFPTISPKFSLRSWSIPDFFFGSIPPISSFFWRVNSP